MEWCLIGRVFDRKGGWQYLRQSMAVPLMVDGATVVPSMVVGTTAAPSMVSATNGSILNGRWSDGSALDGRWTAALWSLAQWSSAPWSDISETCFATVTAQDTEFFYTLSDGRWLRCSPCFVFLCGDPIRDGHVAGHGVLPHAQRLSMAAMFPGPCGPPYGHCGALSLPLLPREAPRGPRGAPRGLLGGAPHGPCGAPWTFWSSWSASWSASRTLWSASRTLRSAQLTSEL